MAKVRVIRSLESSSLSRNERQELAARWAELVCRWCGHAHAGMCPRVKRYSSTRLQNGTITEEVVLWPNDQWAPPPDAISWREVFSDMVAAQAPS